MQQNWFKELQFFKLLLLMKRLSNDRCNFCLKKLKFFFLRWKIIILKIASLPLLLSHTFPEREREGEREYAFSTFNI